MIVETDEASIIAEHIIALTKVRNLQFSLSKKTYYFDIITACGEWRVMGTKEFAESERTRMLENIR